MIELFTKPACVQCMATKRLFNKLGLAYETYDVTEDTAALERLQSETKYTSVPVVIANGESWFGYREDRIKALATQANA